MSPAGSPPLCCTAPERIPESLALAKELGLKVVADPGAEDEVAVYLTADRLELRQLGAGAPGPVFADWSGGAARHRRLYGRERGSTLARAVGLGKGKATGARQVLDATAGLGRDAFALACLGCQVRAVERSGIVFALLRDAHQRAQADPEVAEILHSRLTVEHADAREVLAALSEDQRPDVVLLDPMFPPRRKEGALVKKEMRVTRLVTGDDPDASELLAIARRVGPSRVVVKRPRGAEPLGGAEPSVTCEGKTTRYDVYL